MCKLKLLLEGIECYKDTRVKAYDDLTKLTAKLKSTTMYSPMYYIWYSAEIKFMELEAEVK